MENFNVSVIFMTLFGTIYVLLKAQTIHIHTQIVETIHGEIFSASFPL